MAGRVWDLKLTPDLIQRCYEWAKNSVRGYERGEKEASRQYARPGIDGDIEKQVLGPIGECVFCLAAGLDPLTTVDWSRGIGPGYDVIYRRQRIDVKTTTTTQYLIWPWTKLHFLGTVACDLFVLVLAHQCEQFTRHSVFTLAGWVKRDDFIKHHHLARRGDGTRLDDGTPYMCAGKLLPMSKLILPVAQTYHNDHCCTVCGVYSTRSSDFGKTWRCREH